MGFSIYAKAFDMCYRTRYALKGANGEKVYFFFVYHFSYHSLGDLSTTLEMTVLSQLFFTRKGDLSREGTFGGEVCGNKEDKQKSEGLPRLYIAILKWDESPAYFLFAFSIKSLLALNAGTFLDSITILSPLEGCKPSFLALSLSSKVPKPKMVTFSPFKSASLIMSKTEFTISWQNA